MAETRKKAARRKTVQAFVVEDHALFRSMLVEYVAGLPNIKLAGTAETAEEALERLLEIPVGLVIVDVSLRGMNGLEFLVELRRRQPKVLGLLVSGHASQQYAERAREVGAQGYVTKGQPEAIGAGIAAILAGGTYFPAWP